MKIIEKETRYGNFSFLDNDICIGKSLDVYGEWAQKEIDFLCSLLSKGDTVIDVGANYGEHTLSFAKKVGEEGTVFSIEAQKEIFDILKKNIDKNQYNKRTKAFFAAANNTGEKVFFPEVDYESFINFGSIGHEENDSTGSSVPGMTLNSLNLKKCDLIKIDVEGMEELVLRGSSELIKKTSPILFFECNDLDKGWCNIEFIKKMNLSYSFFVYVDTVYNSKNYNGVKKDIFEGAEESSIVAIRKDHPSFQKIKSQNQVTAISDLNSFVVSILTVNRGVDHPITKFKNIVLGDDNISLLSNKVSELGDIIAEYKKNQKRLEEANIYKDKVVETRDQQLTDYKKNQKRLEGDLQHQQNLLERGSLENLKVCWDVDEFPFYDIVIPVYNGYEFVRECLGSLFKNTNYPNFRVIIIDDAGKCKQTRKYLEKISCNEKVLLLENEENLGFVKTVNRGMKESPNDIVLLNSDTVLTKNWLLKMHKARIINPLAGSVTPLTNNGTICSVPNWLNDNSLPKGLSLDEYATLIEKISLKKYPVLPTAVGFCMLITKDALDVVGLFDEESFGMGYGEENDWCMRAIKAGFTNILDDATFVQHKGSMTFGESSAKQKKLEANLKTLNKKHPEYSSSVTSFIQQNPMLDIIQNIQLNLEFNNGKKNVLYVLHNDISNAIGGTELHVSDLTERFKKEYNIFILFPKEKQIHIKQFANSEREYVFDILSSEEGTPFSTSRIEKIFNQCLDYFSIDLVHFHHLMNLPLSLIKLANKSKSKVVYSLHDYFFHCPCPQLLTPEWNFCNFSQSANTCNSCFPKNYFIKEPFKKFEFLKNRRAFISRNLKQCDQIITPSEFVSKKAQIILGLLPKTINVINHGICSSKNKKKTLLVDKEILNVAILGSFTKIKGSALFAELVNRFKKNKKIKFKIIGKIGDPLTFNTIRNNVTHREYDRKILSSVLKEESIDLVILPSIVPETFCYTLSEALSNGIPVITTSIGAQGQRIETLNGGWSFSVKSLVEKTEKLLLSLFENKERLIDKAKNIRSIKNNDQMFKKYQSNYKKIIPKAKINSKNSFAKVFLDATRDASLPELVKISRTDWKDRVYWFLVRVKLIGLVRPIYFKIFKK